MTLEHYFSDLNCERDTLGGGEGGGGLGGGGEGGGGLGGGGEGGGGRGGGGPRVNNNLIDCNYRNKALHYSEDRVRMHVHVEIMTPKHYFQDSNCERDTLGGGEGGGGLGGGGDGGGGLGGGGEGGGGRGGGGPRLIDNLIDCEKALHYSEDLCKDGMFMLRS